MHCSPNDFCVDPKVFMRELIPHTNDFSPWNLCVGFLNILRNLTCCFPNDLKGANDRIDRFVILLESVLVHAIHKRKRLFGVVEHIAQVIIIDAFHTGMASFKMTFPIAGLRESFITRSTLTLNSSDR